MTKIFTSLIALTGFLFLAACGENTGMVKEDDSRTVCYKVDKTKAGPDVWRVSGQCPKNYSYTK